MPCVKVHEAARGGTLDRGGRHALGSLFGQGPGRHGDERGRRGAVAEEVAKIGEEGASGRGFLLVKYEEGAVFGADAGRWCVIVVRTAEGSRCVGDWCAGRRGVYTAVGG